MHHLLRTSKQTDHTERGRENRDRTILNVKKDRKTESFVSTNKKYRKYDLRKKEIKEYFAANETK
jgi:hypothetical protein